MAGIKANPPQTRMPEKLLRDEELRPYFDAMQEDLYALWLRSGGGIDKVETIVETITIIVTEIVAAQSPLSAQLDDINERIGSGNILTSDETGFTVDLTTLTVDMAEA